MKLHLSGDLHLSHANILRYCNRPWLRKSDLNASGNWKNKEIALERVLQMNKDLIKGFNSVLKEDDFCIHVGDYCFRNSPGGKAGEGEPNTAYNYIKQFKGIWTFIKGNHDGNNSLKTKITSLVIRFGQLSY